MPTPNRALARASRETAERVSRAAASCRQSHDHVLSSKDAIRRSLDLLNDSSRGMSRNGYSGGDPA